MRTPPMIKATSGGDSLEIKLPKSWTELSQPELEYVFRCLSACSLSVALVRITCYFACCKIIAKKPRKRFQLEFTIRGNKKFRYIANADEFSFLVEKLEWVKQPGNFPVRLEHIGKNKAVDAQLHEVKFFDYLRIEALYQGFLTSRKDEALRALASVLYNGEIKRLEEFEKISIINWLCALTALYGSLFAHFMKPATENCGSRTIDAMNAQIRALTGGDITKEKEIFEMDCWRALTELDAKAREAEEFNKSYKQ